METYRSVRLKTSTYDFLAKQGAYGESMDDIILRLSGKERKQKQKEAA
jgi:hypothetical protein